MTQIYRDMYCAVYRTVFVNFEQDLCVDIGLSVHLSNVLSIKLNSTHLMPSLPRS